MKSLRAFKAGREGDVKIAQFQGREHLVVPVVALVEGVIQASNASSPELVLAEEFEKNVDRWNGRPVMLNHPAKDGTPVAANAPSVLDESQIGTVFDARVEDGKLKMNAYVDPTRLEEMGEIGEKMLASIRAGEMFEVSVGTIVEAELENGKAGGKPYAAVWRDISSDHLAFLPVGVKGACSIEMGCGAPRMAGAPDGHPFYGNQHTGGGGGEGGGGSEGKGELFDSDGFKNDETSQIMSDALGDRYGDNSASDTTVPFRTGMSQAAHDIHDKGLGFAEKKAETLGRKLKDTGYKTFVSKFKEKREGPGKGGKARDAWWYEGSREDARAATCGCGGAGSHHASAEAEVMGKKERVAALIASGKTCFKAADAAALEQLTDESITELEKHVANPAETKVEVKPPTQEEFLAANPDIKAAVDAAKAEAALTPEQREKKLLDQNPAIAEIVSSHKAAQAAKRTNLVGKLKSAQKAYTEAELQALPTEQLEKIALLALKEKPSYEGVVPRDASQGEDEEIPAPKSLSDHFRTAKKAAN